MIKIITKWSYHIRKQDCCISESLVCKKRHFISQIVVFEQIQCFSQHRETVQCYPLTWTIQKETVKYFSLISVVITRLTRLFAWIHNDYCTRSKTQKKLWTPQSLMKTRTCSVRNIIFSQRKNIYTAESRICLVEFKLYGMEVFW